MDRKKTQPCVMTKKCCSNRIVFGLAVPAVLFFAGMLCYRQFIRPLPTDPAVAAVSESALTTDEILSERAIRLERPGCPNLHKVSSRLFRGAQPTKDGFAELKKLGIKTIVNLRSNHSDEKLLDNMGLNYISIPIKASQPSEQEVLEFLRIISDPGKQPVFVHCKHGADRTGTMVAVYQVVIQNRDKEKAIREMTAGGFNFHPVYYKTLTEFVRNLDVRKIRDSINHQ